MNINQNSIKIVFSSIILVLAIMRFLFFETVNERMDSVFFLLLLLAFLVPVLPWERLKSFKAGGVEFSLDQPNVVGAIESLGLDRIENKQLRELLSKQSSQIKQLKGARILWIDDKPHNVVGARRLLRALGADVTTATTSEMAEDILNKDNDFDCQY